MIDDGLKRHFLGGDGVARVLPELEAAVANARVTSTEAARRLLAVLDEGGAGGAGVTARPRRTRGT
jgi:hypothetical protein